MHDQSRQANRSARRIPVFAQLDPGIDDADLRIELFTACDGAVDQDGRLSLVGTYEKVGVPAFPFVLPQTTVALRLRFWPGEHEQHALRLVLTGPDGRQIGPLAEAVVTLRSLDEERSAAYNFIFRLDGATVEGPGEYSFDFYLDERLEGRLPICLALNAAPPPTPAC